MKTNYLLSLMLLMILNIPIANAGGRFSEGKEGGNATLTQDGNLVHAEISCKWEKQLTLYVDQEELTSFKSLLDVYMRYTFILPPKLQSLVVCSYDGQMSLNDLLKLPEPSPGQERVAAYVVNVKNATPYILLTQKFLNEVNSNTNGRNKNLLGKVLFRELLHSTLLSNLNEKSLSWTERDLAVSSVLKKVEEFSTKNQNSPVLRQDFQEFNRFLQANKFKSGFQISIENYFLITGETVKESSLLSSFVPKSKSGPEILSGFAEYVKLAAGNISHDKETKEWILYIFGDCFFSYRKFSSGCLEPYKKIVEQFRAHNQSFYFDSADDAKNNTFYMLLNAGAEKILKENNLPVRFGFYNTNSVPERLELINLIAQSQDVIKFSEELIMKGFAQRDFVVLKEYFLGLLPFIQSGIFSPSNVFSCYPQGHYLKASILDFYAVTLEYKNSEPAYSKLVHKIFMNEINSDPELWQFKGWETHIHRGIKVLSDDKCYMKWNSIK